MRICSTSHPKDNVIKQFILFGIVGTIGFVVDAGILYAGLWAGLGYYFGRVVSYLCAATVTWALNRRFTFKSANDNKRGEWVKFVALNLAGFTVNYGTYAACLALDPLFVQHPVLAVAAGSIAGLFVNFAVNKYLVFKA